MAINNGFLIGSSTISTTITDPKLHNLPHTGFTFNGNCIIDSIYISTYEKSDDEILDTSVSTLPEWTNDVVFLASMNNTTDGGNIFGLVDSPTKWSLYRREYQGDELYKVCEVDTSINSWIDYKLEGNKTYEYLLFAETDTQISSPILTDKFDTNFFYGYFLIGSDADSTDSDINQSVSVFKFDLNLTSDKVVENNSLTLLKNFTSYDVAVIGNRNFKSGGFSSIMIPTYNDKYDFLGKQRWQDTLDDLQIFLHDKSYKYLKNRNGKMIKCITEGDGETFSYQFMDEATIGMSNNKNNQPVTVTINYKEIGDVYPITSN